MSAKTETIFQPKLAELWGWLFDLYHKNDSLTDKQFELLVASEKQLKPIIEGVGLMLNSELERIQIYRSKKRELNQLSTNSLRLLNQGFIEKRVKTVGINPDSGDLTDSSQSPPFDSIERMVYDILQERNGQ